MTEEQLREKGYYLFGINQDMFVQVRPLGSESYLFVARGREEALERMEKYFAEQEATHA